MFIPFIGLFSHATAKKDLHDQQFFWVITINGLKIEFDSAQGQIGLIVASVWFKYQSWVAKVY